MSPVAAGGHHGHVPTRAAARAAKSALVETLGADPGVVGIGLARRESDYVVKVNLADADVADRVPDDVDGVLVVTEVVGTIRAL